MVSANSPSITYLGIPKTWSSTGFRISTYVDLLNFIFDLCKFNSSIHCRSVCIDTGEIEFDKSIFSSPIDETDSEISDLLLSIQELIHKEKIKVYFLVTKDYFLGSQIEDIFLSSVKFLNFLGCFLDSIGVDYPSIVVRVGSAYGNRKETMRTFCKRVEDLYESTTSKLCVMNDDKPSLFSITDLLSGIYYDLGIPLCFRTLAHHFNHGGLSIREALYLASTTWKNNEIPLIVHSESNDISEAGVFLSPSVSSGLTMRIPTFGLQCEVIIDSSDKELTYLGYLKNYKSLPPIVINRIADK